jgi:hypothetical protein
MVKYTFPGDASIPEPSAILLIPLRCWVIGVTDGGNNPAITR